MWGSDMRGSTVFTFLVFLLTSVIIGAQLDGKH